MTEPTDGPDTTALRTALWRALHVELDAPPHVLEDLVGVRLAAPDDGWRERGDMHPLGTRGFRASIVSRARFVEELVAEQLAAGVDQYVILGAGLDSLAQRRADLLDSGLQVYEVDQPGTQAWKRRRLEEEGYGIAPRLHLVPVDLESGGSWWEALAGAGFDRGRPAVVAATGVTMYLTRAALETTLRELAALASGSTVALTFFLTFDLVDELDRPGLERSAAGARASGTPFVSFYEPDDLLALARRAGFPHAEHLSSKVLADRWFAGRPDGLRPSTGEDVLLLRT